MRCGYPGAEGPLGTLLRFPTGPGDASQTFMGRRSFARGSSLGLNGKPRLPDKMPGSSWAPTPDFLT